MCLSVHCTSGPFLPLGQESPIKYFQFFTLINIVCALCYMEPERRDTGANRRSSRNLKKSFRCWITSFYFEKGFVVSFITGLKNI